MARVTDGKKRRLSLVCVATTYTRTYGKIGIYGHTSWYH